MDPSNNEPPELTPEYLSDPGLDLWKPDQLYIEWLGFLYGIWRRVDYL